MSARHCPDSCHLQLYVIRNRAVSRMSSKIKMYLAHFILDSYIKLNWYFIKNILFAWFIKRLSFRIVYFFARNLSNTYLEMSKWNQISWKNSHPKLIIINVKKPISSLKHQKKAIFLIPNQIKMTSRNLPSQLLHDSVKRDRYWAVVGRNRPFPAQRTPRPSAQHHRNNWE